MSRRSVPVIGSARSCLGGVTAHRPTPGADRMPSAGYHAPMLLLVDLDGVVYRGADPVPGVAAVLADRVRRGDEVVYVTNNSMHYRADYVERLAAMGAPVAADRVVSSPRATALWLAEQEPRPRRVLAFGGPGLRRELEDCGFEVVTAAEAAARAEAEGLDGFEAAGRPDAVVVGLDPEVTYRRLAVAADAIRAGALFVATNRDPTYPMERRLMPGAGSMVAAIETASGVVPISIGKPEPLLLLEAAHVVGADPRDAIMIGDGIGTDLAAARAVGARCILMLTGVTTRAQIDALPAAERPLAVAEDAAELARILDEPQPRPEAQRSAPVSGTTVAQASNSVRSRARTGGSAKATSRARRSIAHSSGTVRPIRRTARAYSSDRLMSETVLSSVDRVTETPARWSRASGWSASAGTMPAWTLLVGHRSRVTPRAMSSATSDGSSIASGPWAIRSGSTARARRTWAAPPHSPAWRVIRRPPARAASKAGAKVSGSGTAPRHRPGPSRRARRRETRPRSRPARG